jgi:hypothetical protein
VSEDEVAAIISGGIRVSRVTTVLDIQIILGGASSATVRRTAKSPEA